MSKKIGLFFFETSSIKNAIWAFATCFFLNACSSEHKGDDKAQPVTETDPAAKNTNTVNASDTETKTTSPSVTPSPTLTPVKTETQFLLYKMSMTASSSPRPTAKIFSVQITPTKITSSTGMTASSIFAKCGDQILAHTDFKLASLPKRENEIYRPSLLLASDLICGDEIVIGMTIFGYEVQVSDVSIGDVTETANPAEITN